MEAIKLLYTLGASILLWAYLVFHWNTARRKGYKHAPRYRLLDPIFGLDYRLRFGLSCKNWFHFHKKYGHTFAISPLVGKTQISTSHPDNCYEIMTGKDFGVGWRQTLMAKLTGAGLLTMDGEEWRAARKMAKPCFEKKNIDDLVFVGEMMDIMMKKIPGNGETFDLFPILNEMFIDTSLHFLFGLDTRQKTPEVPFTAHQFHDIWYTGIMLTGLRILLGGIVNLVPDGGYYSKVCGKIHTFVEFFIKVHSPVKIDRYSAEQHTITQVLLSQLEDQANSQAQKNIRHHLVQILIASQDTTPTLLSNTVEFLARDPTAWKELRKEVLRRGGGAWSFVELRDNSFIHNLLKESLRLRPVVAAIAREALRDTTLPIGGGPDGQSPIFVRKGDHGVANIYVLQQTSHGFGKSIGKFDPSRWDIINPMAKEYMPFGANPRMCLGKDKALVEAAYVLVRLATEFEVLELRDDRFAPRLGITMKNANGCKIAFRKAL